MKNDVLKVYRHELKFLLSQMEYRHLRCLLGALMDKDLNMKKNQDYYIRSLYFDTVTNMDYRSKIMGVSDRKKIRLRIYSIDTDKVKLEIKNKEADYSLKETATISREDAERLAMCDYKALLGYHDTVSQKTYHNFMDGGYRPKVIVDYDREAYLLPIENIRFTFDKKIRAAKAAGLFDDSLAMCGILSEAQVILEVKYDRYLPRHLSDVLSSICMQRMSISKYCMAREIVG